MEQKSYDQTKLNGIICVGAGWVIAIFGFGVCIGPAFGVIARQRGSGVYWRFWEQITLGAAMIFIGYALLRLSKYLLGPAEEKDK